MARLLWVNTSNCSGISLCSPFQLSKSSLRKGFIKACSSSLNIQKLPTSLPMEGPGAVSLREMPLGIDEKTEEEYASQAKLLQEFTDISIIDKAWTFRSGSGNNSQAMFFMSQMNLLANKRKKYLLSSHILKESVRSLTFQWSPFPVELLGVSTVVPSPSGLKLLVVRNGESGSPTQLEIWSPLKLQKEIHIPQSVHGPLYVDGWFEGISWSFDEALIAYVAEEPMPSKPIFDGSGYKKEGSSDKDGGSWKGQGDWEEDWGETYARKRRPALFVVNINSGGVQAVKGIPKTLSVGQVIWVPPTSKNLVFVGWPSENGPEQVARKLGMKYCYNRPCSLYVIRAPFSGPEVDKLQFNSEAEDMAAAVSITQGMSSAFFPRFSPDGKFLVFLSAKSAVDTGAHCATDSLHRLDWPSDGKSVPPIKIYDVVPVVMCPEDGCVPGLYCSSFLQQPWLSDGCTMILSSTWGSIHVILSVNVMSGKVLRISPNNSSYSWDALAVDADNILAISSSPIDPPQIKYGWYLDPKENTNANVAWEWLDISIPSPSYPEKVQSFLSSMQFSVLKIPIRDNSENLTKGAKQPFEAIFVLSKPQSPGSCNPLIVILHGGPHSVSLTSYSKSLAFLSSLGFNSLQVNYRGSLGFGEEALQSLPGKIGCQDVNDVLAAVDHVIGMGLADPTKIVVLGGSHGGFLTTHLIGQAPDRFVAAAVRNPVCNLALMVGTSDIPDWCYVEACGTEGKNSFTEAPSVEDLHLLYNKSPISHLLKVKAPVLFLLGAQDLRVPASNGLQYARALRKEGGEVKVIVFPDDVHAIDRPQSDFESFLNIGVWFKKYCG